MENTDIVERIIKLLANKPEKQDEGKEKGIALDSNEIFLSEDDLKFSFARAAEKLGAKNIILEYPIMTKDLYNNEKDEHIKKCFSALYKNDSKYNNGREFIDVCFEYGNNIYFIELKYRTSKLKKCSRHNKETLFSLKDHKAANLGGYAIYEDMERMENVLTSKNIKQNHKNKKIKSYVFALANCDLNNNQNDPNCACSNVRLEGQTNIHNICKKYKVNKIEQLTTYKELDKDKINYISIRNYDSIASGARRPIHLHNQYDAHWKNFKVVNECEFKYLLIELK